VAVARPQALHLAPIVAMMIEAEPHTFAKVVKIAPEEFHVLFAPSMSRRGISFNALICRKRTGFLRRARFTYILSGPGAEGSASSTHYDSRAEVVERMISDNLQHNEGRSCWVEF
jgi:hypothetical protein